MKNESGVKLKNAKFILLVLFMVLVLVFFIRDEVKEMCFLEY